MAESREQICECGHRIEQHAIGRGLCHACQKCQGFFLRSDQPTPCDCGSPSLHANDNSCIHWLKAENATLRERVREATLGLCEAHQPPLFSSQPICLPCELVHDKERIADLEKQLATARYVREVEVADLEKQLAEAKPTSPRVPPSPEAGDAPDR
jgi:hypothetical protein